MSFFDAFVDELEKLAEEKEEKARVEDILPHAGIMGGLFGGEHVHKRVHKRITGRELPQRKLSLKSLPREVGRGALYMGAGLAAGEGAKAGIKAIRRALKRKKEKKEEKK